jgi:hypothetical protein
VRAYDYQGRIAGGVLVSDGDQALAVTRQVLSEQDMALVHLRNVGYGCYNCFVRRAEPPPNRHRAEPPPALTAKR